MPRKRISRRQDELVTYLVKFNHWDWSYSFGLDHSHAADNPYLEFRHLEIAGSLLRPKSLKIEKVEAILIPEKSLNEENRLAIEPHAAGSLRKYNSNLQALLSLLADVLATIISALAAEKLRYVIIDGTKLRYRKCLVRHFRLDSSYDEDDFP